MKADRAPGQPLAALASLLGIWVIVRIALWQPLFVPAATGATSSVEAGEYRASLASRTDFPAIEAAPSARSPTDHAETRAISPDSPGFSQTTPSTVAKGVSAVVGVRSYATADVEQNPTAAAELLPFADERRAFDHSLRRKQSSRISADAWLVMRPQAGSDTTRPLVGRYGASQAGATVRYRLFDGSHGAALVARTSLAIDAFSDRELALGVTARPLPPVPIRIQGEMRARSIGRSVELAPAVLAVSEIPTLDLPLGIAADPYIAAGYVGGRQTTGFVDGSVRIERKVATAGPVEFRVGTGAWGGAQEGAAALDVGPTASARTALAGRQLVLSLDYRQRVAGSAVPRSGPAVTLSTGF